MKSSVLVLALFAAGCATQGPSAAIDAGTQDASAPDASLDLRPCIEWDTQLTARPGRSCSIKMPGGAVANMGARCTMDPAHAGLVVCDNVYMDAFGRQGALVADGSECAFVQCSYGP